MKPLKPYLIKAHVQYARDNKAHSALVAYVNNDDPDLKLPKSIKDECDGYLILFELKFLNDVDAFESNELGVILRANPEYQSDSEDTFLPWYCIESVVISPTENDFNGELAQVYHIGIEEKEVYGFKSSSKPTLSVVQ